MKTLLTVALAASLWTGLASAKNFTIGDDKPVAVVTMPDAWEPDEFADGVSATSADKSVYVAVESVKVRDVKDATVEGIKFFKKNGVTIDPATMKQKDVKINGLEAVDIQWEGKDEDGPTKVSLTFVILSDKDALLLTYWASPKGEDKHMKTLMEISDSIRPIQR